MCDVTHHNYFSFVLIAMNEVRRRVVYIIDNLFFFFLVVMDI